MATTSTQIDILLKARADLAGLKAARGELGGMQREIKQSNEAFKGLAATGRNLLGGLGVGLSTGALIGGIKQVIDYGSKITDLATQTGTTTDAFQTLAIAAQDAGVDQQKLAATLIFLRKSLSETAAGVGEARNSFAALGLDARELANIPLERALEKIAKAVANAEDRTTAFSQAVKILGAENVGKLQEVLNRLAKDGFDKINEEVKDLRVTPEQLKTLDDASDKLARIGTELKVLGAQGVVRVAVLLRVKREGESDVERFIAYLRDSSNLGLDALLLLNPKLRFLVETLQSVTRQTEEAATAAANLADETDAASDAGERILTLAEKEKLAREGSLAVAKELAEVEKFTNTYIAERQKMLDEEHKRTVELNSEAAKLGKEQADFLMEQLPPLERHKILQEQLNALKKEAVGLLGQTDNATFERRLKIDTAILQTNKDIAKINAELTGSLDGFFNNIDAASTSMEMFKEETADTKKVADELGWAFASSFESAILEGKKFSEVLKGLAQDILKIVIRNTITAPIGNYISGLFGGVFGGGKATGGPVSGGTAYIVGERGPELFVPSASGSIVPNHELMAAGAGGGGETYNFTQNFMGGVTRSEMADMIPQIIEASKSAVLDARRRRQPGFA